jgi:hypothetical protein
VGWWERTLATPADPPVEPRRFDALADAPDVAALLRDAAADVAATA